MRYAHPFEMEPRPGGGFTATFPDVPEAITEGDTVGETCESAEDALVTALSCYTDDARPMPTLSAGISNAERGRRLDLDEKAVRGPHDSLHRSHIGQIEAASRVLGKRLEVQVLEVS